MKKILVLFSLLLTLSVSAFTPPEQPINYDLVKVDTDVGVTEIVVTLDVTINNIEESLLLDSNLQPCIINLYSNIIYTIKYIFIDPGLEQNNNINNTLNKDAINNAETRKGPLLSLFYRQNKIRV